MTDRTVAAEALERERERLRQEEERASPGGGNGTANGANPGAAHVSGSQAGQTGQQQSTVPELIMLDDCKLDTDVFWLVDDLLPKCSMVMVYGPGGSGKTYLGGSAAFGFASGRWFTYDAEPGAVLICAFERPGDAEDRLAALRDQYGYKGLSVALLKLGGKTLNEALADGIIQRAKELAAACGTPVRVIEIDTVRAALGGRKEDGEGLGALRLIGERIHAETGATVVWVHHEGKGEGMGPRGALDLADGCAVWWRVEEHENGDRVVHVEKANRGPCHVPLFAFKLLPFEAGRDKRKKAIELCKLEMTDLEAAQASPVRQRFGRAYGKAEKDPEAGLGKRQKLFMRTLRKLHARHPEGVERDAHRSAFLLELNAVQIAGGKEPLEPRSAASTHRQILAGLMNRTSPMVVEIEGRLSPCAD